MTDRTAFDTATLGDPFADAHLDKSIRQFIDDLDEGIVL